MDPAISIRVATVSDVADVLPLVGAYWNFEAIDGFDATLVSAQLHRMVAEPSLGRLWLARSNGVGIGYLLATFVFSLEHLGLTGEIDEFFVLPTYRRHGIGAALADREGFEPSIQV